MLQSIHTDWLTISTTSSNFYDNQSHFLAKDNQLFIFFVYDIRISAPDKLCICVFHPIKMSKNAKKFNNMPIENATILICAQIRQIQCVQHNSFNRKC
jgi:hypothetical protein